MDEDLDRVVERIAALLLSDKPEDIQRGSAMPEEMSRSAGTGAWTEKFSRLVQEIAAYQGGAVLDYLLAGAFWERRPHPRNEFRDSEFSHYVACCIAVNRLTANQVVVGRCLKDTGNDREVKRAQDIYLGFCGDAEGWARGLERGQNQLNPLVGALVITPLECMTNFARTSEVFREAMRQACEERSLFDQLGFFLSPQFLKKVSVANAYHVRHVISELLTSLAGSEDSQMWVLDRGLLRLMAAIYECSPSQFRQDAFRQTDAPTYRCNLILLMLVSKDATAEKLRAHNALAGFRPHRRKINEAAEQSPDFWGFLEAKLRGRHRVLLLDARSRQSVNVIITGTGIPVVCSWKHCTAGAEPEGRKFSKCRHCHVARYCSKHHRKLHWPTHKAHCQASRTEEAERTKSSECEGSPR